LRKQAKWIVNALLDSERTPDESFSCLCGFLTTLLAPEIARQKAQAEAVVLPLRDDLRQLVQNFLRESLTPEAVLKLERQLQQQLQEAGRRLLESLYNSLEPEEPEALPKRAESEHQEFSRKNQKSNARSRVGTLFGEIVLRRFSYEPLREAREAGRKSFAPLEQSLGIVAGHASPALAERVGREACDKTQAELREWLKREHHVSWSVDTLREVTQAVSEGIAEHQHEAQKSQLLAWLHEANQSKGRRKIVLAAGRDGIMLPIRDEPTYKEGAVATLSVYDRRGRRLGTTYLGTMPEAYQRTLSDQLTRLVKEVLSAWEGPWPRLAYVTDAGYHPTDYFQNVLSQLEHPRHKGCLMNWVRIVDYYHACEYLAKLAHVLFDEPLQIHAWLNRMRKRLKHEPNAVFRILHSAAYYRSQQILTEAAETTYQKAYAYLEGYRAHLDFATYHHLGLPLGSGVTEAACKTVFTQRFKCSGMSWSLDGGLTILRLRLAKLSRIWDTIYRQSLAPISPPRLIIQQETNPTQTCQLTKKAA
jgi:hypothetical protein